MSWHHHSTKKRRAVGLLNRMRDKLKDRGKEGTTPVTTAFVQNLESKSVRKERKKKYIYIYTNIIVLIRMILSTTYRVTDPI